MMEDLGYNVSKMGWYDWLRGGLSVGIIGVGIEVWFSEFVLVSVLVGCSGEIRGDVLEWVVVVD